MAKEKELVTTSVKEKYIAGTKAFTPSLARLSASDKVSDSSDSKASTITDMDRWVASIQEYLLRAKNYLAHNDTVQASEKLYKATEESIKFLTTFYKIDEYEDARKHGHWWQNVLRKASVSLAKKRRKKFISEAWEKAYSAHTFGFHENSYSEEDVKAVIPFVEKLVNYVQEVQNAR